MSIKVWITKSSDTGTDYFVKLWTNKPIWRPTAQEMWRKGGYMHACRKSVVRLLRGTGKRIPRTKDVVLELEITAK